MNGASMPEVVWQESPETLLGDFEVELRIVKVSNPNKSSGIEYHFEYWTSELGADILGIRRWYPLDAETLKEIPDSYVERIMKLLIHELAAYVERS